MSNSSSSVNARVKWFNPDKGFGFVAPLDGSPDAFVHVSALQSMGLSHLPEGAEIVCEIGSGPKGPQVLQIIEVGEVAMPAAGGPPDDEPSISGAVKWFAIEKGFGFIAADDGGKDIFIHKNVLRRCGVPSLDEGQRVQVVTAPTPKGREATWISVG